MPRKKIPQNVIDAAYEAAAFKPSSLPSSARSLGQKGSNRIMYIENKSGQLAGGEARIGRVSFSKTGSTLYYREMSFQSLKGAGSKENYYELESGEGYWISGPKRNGEDRLYGERVPVLIDEDVREEYWTKIRKLPEKKKQKHT
jgi:hypothetical protein